MRMTSSTDLEKNANVAMFTRTVAAREHGGGSAHIGRGVNKNVGQARHSIAQ